MPRACKMSQFLGAYEYGALRFALPIVSGNERHETPTGEFYLTDTLRVHRSCLYTVEGTKRPYPMNYALKFYVDREGVSYWIHAGFTGGICPRYRVEFFP
ncbi:MAG TPA: L,D-transpeptidase [Nitrospira sp.]|nr:L,D-transpeptidase [Nitrospira sp.]